MERGYGLLKDLGALDSSCEITELGRQMSRFPLHPRFARLLIEANRLGVMQDAALIAALSQGRLFYRASRDTRIRREQVRQIEDHANALSDYFVHLKAWEIARGAKFNPNACGALGIHGAAARLAGAVAQQIYNSRSSGFGYAKRCASRCRGTNLSLLIGSVLGSPSAAQ